MEQGDQPCPLNGHARLFVPRSGLGREHHGEGREAPSAAGHSARGPLQEVSAADRPLSSLPSSLGPLFFTWAFPDHDTKPTEIQTHPSPPPSQALQASPAPSKPLCKGMAQGQQGFWVLPLRSPCGP